MPTYQLQNDKTGEVKEIFCSYKDKDKILKEHGKNWRWLIGAPEIQYQALQSNTKRAGSHWNDILKTIKKNSGKGSTIQHD